MEEGLADEEQHKMSSDEGADNSAGTDISEWDEPQTESEVHIIIEESDNGYSKSIQEIRNIE